MSCQQGCSQRSGVRAQVRSSPGTVAKCCRSYRKASVLDMENRSETCAICGCKLHRSGEYATSTVAGRSHATRHHLVAERFFGRSTNRRGTKREGIFAVCPWGHEGKTDVYCYECHEELLHNPVLLPEDIRIFTALVKKRGLHEDQKPDHAKKIGGRILLLHEAISRGLKILTVEGA